MVKLLNKSSSNFAIHLCNILITAEASTSPLPQIAEDQADQLQSLLSDYGTCLRNLNIYHPNATSITVSISNRILIPSSSMQKAAIEKMIVEILHQKIIQPSNSALSVPVVLGKN